MRDDSINQTQPSMPASWAVELLNEQSSGQHVAEAELTYACWPQLFRSSAGPFRDGRIALRSLTLFRVEAWLVYRGDRQYGVVFVNAQPVHVGWFQLNCQLEQPALPLAVDRQNNAAAAPYVVALVWGDDDDAAELGRRLLEVFRFDTLEQQQFFLQGVHATTPSDEGDEDQDLQIFFSDEAVDAYFARFNH